MSPYVHARILVPSPLRTLIVLMSPYVHARILIPSPVRTLVQSFYLRLRSVETNPKKMPLVARGGIILDSPVG
eukprot:255339-Alexandrium_andersonii.AAC.1